MTRTLTIGEAVTIQRGTTYKSALIGQPGPVLLGLGTILRNGGFRGDSLRTYGGDSPDKLLVRPGELYASLKDVTQSADLLGAVARVPVDGSTGRLTQDTVRLDLTGVVAADYLYWVMRTPQYRAYCRAHATGTTNLGLPREDFFAFPFPEPTERTENIVALLGALDDKIESNRRLVQLLLQRAALEFEARFEARETALPLGDLCSVVDCLHSKKPERVEHGKRLLQLNNITDDGLIDRAEYFGISDTDYANWARKFETREWDLVITNVGRIGAVGRIPAQLSAALGRNMTGVRPSDPATDGAFLAVALQSPAVRREIELRTDAGTIMNALNVRSIPHLRVQSATRDERAHFSQFAGPLLQAADRGLLQVDRLAATRDALLPELLSGRIRVP